MPKKKVITITRKMPAAVEKMARKKFDIRINSSDTLYSQDVLINESKGSDGLLICSNDKLDNTTISALPDSIKIISCYTAGHENVDGEAARKRGIIVTNSPDSVTNPTAEITMLLILGAARRGAEADQLVRNGLWSGWHTEFMIGKSLNDKRLGIFGMGRIGRAVATRARGFGLEIHYHNRKRLPLSEVAGAIYHPNSDSLLKVSDILSLHCALTKNTERFLTKERISLLPKGSIVINTSRGEVIDDDALIKALKNGKVASAGLDVFSNEPELDRRYKDLKNTFLLPHIGSATREGRDGMGFQAINNLLAFFKGERPPNQIN